MRAQLDGREIEVFVVFRTMDQIFNISTVLCPCRGSASVFACRICICDAGASRLQSRVGAEGQGRRREGSVWARAGKVEVAVEKRTEMEIIYAVGKVGRSVSDYRRTRRLQEER